MTEDDDIDITEDLIGKMGDRESNEGGAAKNQLKSFIERIENLEAEKREIAERVKLAYLKGKVAGHVPKVLREIVAIRKKDLAERREEQEIYELYASAIGGTGRTDAYEDEEIQINIDEVRPFIEEAEYHLEEQGAVADDIKEVYTEAKSMGFDTKQIRKIVKDRRKNRAQLAEEVTVLNNYMNALSLA